MLSKPCKEIAPAHRRDAAIDVSSLANQRKATKIDKSAYTLPVTVVARNPLTWECCNECCIRPDPAKSSKVRTQQDATRIFTEMMVIAKERHQTISNMFTKLERDNFWLKELRACFKAVDGAKGVFEYRVGNSRQHIVCHSAFCYINGMSTYQMKRLKKHIYKEKGYVIDDFKDQTTVSQETVDSLCKRFKQENNGEELDRNTLAKMQMPNGPKSMIARAWMEQHFKYIGDLQPNKDEIHLDPIEKKEIYNEYCEEMESIYYQEPVSYSQFLHVWETSLSHVKIRQYKAVTGKCETCAQLSGMRQKYHDNLRRSLITELHAYHRTTYIGEKQAYYDHNTLACNEATRYMSIITDGMAQNHCLLPHVGNQKPFPSPLSQHLQGVIESGQVFNIYRTFHNVSGGSNLAIHCMLLQLEDRLSRFNGKIPETLFIQADGGTENSNRATLAICELLVATRVTKTVYFSRLPVGHTHENIDGKYGQLWLGFRNSYIYSPQEYEAEMKKIMSKDGSKLPFNVIDLFVVPDYSKLLKPHIEDMAGCFRNETTQLIWRFTAVERSQLYPLGVKTQYRAYAQDITWEIIVDDRSPPDQNITGLRAIKRINDWQPRLCSYNTRDVGMHILSHMPRGTIYPAEFRKDSAQELIKCIEKFNELCSVDSPAAVSDWEAFKAIAPTTDNVNEYLRYHYHQFHVPLKDSLFRNCNVYVPDDVVMTDEVTSIINNRNSHLTLAARHIVNNTNTGTVSSNTEEVMLSMDSTKWSNNGVPRPAYIPATLIMPIQDIRNNSVVEARLNDAIDTRKRSMEAAEDGMTLQYVAELTQAETHMQLQAIINHKKFTKPVLLLVCKSFEVKGAKQSKSKADLQALLLDEMLKIKGLERGAAITTTSEEDDDENN